ncbi:MAG: hydrogenase formation protein HypD [Planctomycetales bacterium]|nr:hydrogenase formation protein HypD [Planctomycetales bacterium]
MKFLDEYRDREEARRRIDAIRNSCSRCWVLMEVCGGQTHSLLRHGIDTELSGVVELIHGPGCPVCVTPEAAIDLAQQLALQDEVILASFGDMLRVPGRRGSLLETRAMGGDIRIVYSPLDAVEIARRQPHRQVVFFAVGFETTAPSTALAIRQAAAEGLANFTILLSHVRVLPAMEALAAAPDNRVQGFLAAGHVCTITGYADYRTFVDTYRLPVVVTGFEPVDLLQGILECVQLLEAGEPKVANAYARIVKEQGNAAALELLEDVFEPADVSWRGFGTVPAGGLRLRDAWRAFDATERFRLSLTEPVGDCEKCRLAEVLAGRMRPDQCEAFGAECTPENPLGAPMVSSEGACAAYYRYHPPTAGGGRSAEPREQQLTKGRDAE